jgi:hypothetical protein
MGSSNQFEVNHCLAEVPYVDQHLVPMMWLFDIKTDGTKKARLVGRGDMMKPWVDFDPNAVLLWQRCGQLHQDGSCHRRQVKACHAGS